MAGRHHLTGNKMKTSHAVRLLAVIAVAGSSWAAGVADGERSSAYRRDLEEAAAILQGAGEVRARYDYVVTGAVNLVVGWKSRDDVGQGYISLGRTTGPARIETIRLLMGSDPAKAPLGINRWGAAFEVFQTDQGSSSFFGFMNASNSESMSASREELRREGQNGQHTFRGIISHADGRRAVSVAIPIISSTNFTIHQLPLAQQAVMSGLQKADRAPRLLDFQSASECPDGMGFLFSVRELINASLAGGKVPVSRPYIYNARRYRLVLEKCEPVEDLKVSVHFRGASQRIERRYRQLREGRFRAFNLESGEQTEFKVAYGSSGRLKGIPVQIEYRPNWWFRVTLNLNPTLQQCSIGDTCRSTSTAIDGSGGRSAPVRQTS
jgi:hypothetical protein